MPGLVPGIHDLLAANIKEDVDGRDKPGHDSHAVFCTFKPSSAMVRSRMMNF